MSEDGWIEHVESGRPGGLRDDELVQCRLRVASGWHEQTHRADAWDWDIIDDCSDIVAWRR